ATVNTATDEDGGAITFTMGASDYYAIDSISGEVTLTSDGADYVNAGNDLPAFTVTATSSNSSAQDTLNPSVSTVNDALVLTVTLTEVIAEGAASSYSVVATSVASDEDGGVITYTINDNDENNDYYVINETSGTVTLTTAGVDFVNGGGDLPAFDVTATSAGIDGSTATQENIDPLFSPADPNPPVITNITDDSQANDYSNVTLHGTGDQTGNEIRVVDINGDLVGTTVVDSNGHWTLDISASAALPEGSNEFLMAVEINGAGNNSEYSNTVHYWHGNHANIYSEAADDFILFGAGDDVLSINANDDNGSVVSDGGSGNDKVIFSEGVENYDITIVTDDLIEIRDSNNDLFILKEFEQFTFGDKTYTVEELSTPILDLNGAVDDFNYTATFIEGGSGTQIVADDMVITSATKENIKQADVKLIAYGNNDSILLFNGVVLGAEPIITDSGITITASEWIDNSGTSNTRVVLTGIATTQQYSDALKSISYVNQSIVPIEGSQRIDIWVQDASGDYSNTANSRIGFISVNDAPIVIDLDLNLDAAQHSLDFSLAAKVSDVEDDQHDNDGKSTDIKILSLPAKGTLYQIVDGNEVELIVGSIIDANADLRYESADGDEQDNIFNAQQYFKTVDDTTTNIQLEGVTITGGTFTGNSPDTTSQLTPGDLHYDDEPGENGIGVNDNEIEVTDKEYIAVTFNDQDVTNIDLEIGSLWVNYDVTRTADAELNILVFKDGVVVQRLDYDNLYIVTGGYGGNGIYVANIDVASGFDEIRIFTTSPTNIASNLLVLGVTVNHTDTVESFTYKAIDSDNLSSENIGTVTLNIKHEIANNADLAAELNVVNAAGNEDSAISLDISALLKDSSDTLTVQISDIPSGAILKSGDEDIAINNGVASLTLEQLNNLTIQAPQHSDNEMSLTVSAISNDQSSNVVTSKTLNVEVFSVADQPTLTTAYEVTYNINPSPINDPQYEDYEKHILGDLQNNQTYSGSANNDYIQVDKAFGGSNLLAKGGDDVIEVTSDIVGSTAINGNSGYDILILSKSENSYEVDSYNENGGSINTRIKDLDTGATLTVTNIEEIKFAVADTVTVALNINATLVDTDGSESMIITIENLPQNAEFSQGNIVDGVWTGTASDLIGLTMTLPNIVTDISLSITATTTETNADQASSTATIEFSLDGTIAEATNDSISNVLVYQNESETISKSDINELGNIGDGFLNGTNPDDIETANFDFGVANAGQVVTLSFDAKAFGGWEDGSDNNNWTVDRFVVSADTATSALLNKTYYGNGNDDSWVSETENYQYQVTLGENGQVNIEFNVASTMTNEVVNISNISMTKSGRDFEISTLIIDVLANDQFSDMSQASLSLSNNQVQHDGKNIGSLSIIMVDGKQQLLFTPNESITTLTNEQLSQVTFDYDVIYEGNTYTAKVGLDLSLLSANEAQTTGSSLNDTIVVNYGESVQANPNTLTVSYQGTDGILTDAIGNRVVGARAGTSYSDSSAQVIDSGAGNDVIESGAGDDVIFAGDSNSILDTTVPTDIVSHGIMQATISDTSNSAVDAISQLLNAGLTSDPQLDIVNAGSGNDVIFGQAGSDILYGHTGDDYIDGGADNDGLRGGTGNDILLGQAGNDWLIGDAGNDIIIGGLGNDLLTGGADSDTFIWLAGDYGVDHVTDFRYGTDTLDITDLLHFEQADINNLDLLLSINFDNGDTTITVIVDSIEQKIVLDGLDFQGVLGTDEKKDILNTLFGNDGTANLFVNNGHDDAPVSMQNYENDDVF
ncbi:MAG: type I secretion C-terminal target domain-containing protein, partial [Psychrobium sp.]|nr:type I secretion C-terminal target domain-containing protein [Psychrobium sp.]